MNWRNEQTSDHDFGEDGTFRVVGYDSSADEFSVQYLSFNEGGGYETWDVLHYVNTGSSVAVEVLWADNNTGQMVGYAMAAVLERMFASQVAVG